MREWRMQTEASLLAEAGAVAPVARAELVRAMAQQHDACGAPVAPPARPVHPGRALPAACRAGGTAAAGGLAHRALCMRGQPQRCADVEVHDGGRRVQQVCACAACISTPHPRTSADSLLSPSMHAITVSCHVMISAAFHTALTGSEAAATPCRYWHAVS